MMSYMIPARGPMALGLVPTKRKTAENKLLHTAHTHSSDDDEPRRVRDDTRHMMHISCTTPDARLAMEGGHHLHDTPRPIVPVRSLPPYLHFPL